MPWRTIMVCDECYLARRKLDRDLVDRPVRMVVVEDDCHDCGAVGVAAVPIRAEVP